MQNNQIKDNQTKVGGIKTIISAHSPTMGPALVYTGMVEFCIKKNS